MRLDIRWQYGVAFLLAAAFGAVGACAPTEREYSTGGGGGGCPAGFAECDGDPATVCETDTTASLEHCGSCENACGTAPAAGIECVSGTCQITTCDTDRANCDNFIENGCETNPSTSFEHCGTCGNSCEASNAITACVTGTCQLAQCIMDYLDCDMNALTGCEVDPKTNAEHCGGCGMACMTPNAMMGCENSQCFIATCNDNFGDCDQLLDNGCETDLLTSPYNCGVCGTSCGGGMCVNGACNSPIPVSMLSYPAGKMVLNKDDLYVGGRAIPGEIARINVLDNSMMNIATANGAVNQLVVEQNYLFVASTGGAWRFNLDGSGQFSYINGTTRAIAIDMANVYWSSAAAIRTSPINGGASNLFFGGPTTSYGITKDTKYMYFTFGDGSVYSTPIGVPNANQIAVGPPIGNNPIATDGSYLYWASKDGIHSMPSGGGPITTLAQTTPTVQQIAIDDFHVYFTDDAGGTVQRVAKDGSVPPEVLAIDQKSPCGIAVGPLFVYWSTSGDGAVQKLPK